MQHAKPPSTTKLLTLSRLPLVHCLAIAALLFSELSVARAQEKTSRPVDLRASVIRHLDMPFTMPFYRTADDWMARREAIRRQILFSAGLWPPLDKCPLNAHIFGRLERKGYSIEKVYFESLPGFYVTGNLYRPIGKKGPFPGILSPHGHWAYGRLQHNELCSVPSRCINLAMQGYVVFAYDMVGYNDSRQVDHRFRKESDELWGFGSLGLHLWNSMRSVDFIESLPDVDRSRLACTGASGGGTQTFLLAAVDDRISMAAPVNMISAHMQGGDTCENAPNLRIDTNNMEIAALIAPRPMIMVSATGDWTKNTLEVEFPAIQRIYRLLGAEDKLSAVRVQAEHNYNRESREHVYRWLAKWMQGDVAPDRLREVEVTPERPADVLVFYGQPLPTGAKTENQIESDFIQAAEATINTLKPRSRSDWEKYTALFEPALRCSLMAEYPKPDSVRAFAVQPVTQASCRVVRFYLSRQGKADRVAATLWIPPAKVPVRQAALLIHPEGAEVFEKEGHPRGFVEELLKAGCSVLLPDVFNTGRSAFVRGEERKFFTTYNRTDDANRIQDILTSLSYLRSQAGSLPIKIVGFERAGPWSLIARGLAADDAAAAVDLDQFDARSDRAYLEKMNIPGIRRAGDFRTAAILNLRSPLWVFNASPSFPAEWIQSVFETLGEADALRVDGSKVGEASLLEWLLHDLKKPKS